jgi:ABC-2 type transport system ATP-binding protein
MKTHVNIIIGICCHAPLTIFDEPTLGLDAAVRKEFYSILLNDYMKYPRTIIISSHLLNEIDMLLEDIVLIEEGKLLMHTSMEEFRDYAIELSGDSEFLSKYVKSKEVINESRFGNSLSIVIANDLSDKEREMLKTANVDIKSVSTQDLFIYMTSKGEDLFDE